MSTPTNIDRPSIWLRLARAVRYVLDMEPAAVLAVFRALLVVLGTLGLDGLDLVDTRGTAFIVALYGLVEVVTTLRTRASVTPVAAVVERVEGDRVVAGAASELPTGQDVRAVGSLNEGGLWR